MKKNKLGSNFIEKTLNKGYFFRKIKKNFLKLIAKLLLWLKRRGIKPIYFLSAAIFFALILIMAVASLVNKTEPVELPKTLAPIEPVKNIETTEKKRTLGIVTFFHTAPLIGQLAIYNDWEGNYRMSNAGNKASFIFIASDIDNGPEIFSIDYRPLEEWLKSREIEEKNNFKELDRKDKTVFILHVPKSNNLKGDNAKKFEGMMRDIEAIKKTFRIIKLGK